METPKFTPGRWYKNVWTTGRRTVEARTGLVLAEIHRTHKDHEIDANANLISAAPEMYAALNRCIEVFTQLADAGNYPAPLFGKDGWMFASRAIAKAEGREL